MKKCIFKFICSKDVIEALALKTSGFTIYHFIKLARDIEYSIINDRNNRKSGKYDEQNYEEKNADIEIEMKNLLK